MLNTSEGRHVLKNHNRTVRRSVPQTCWNAELQTPKPRSASVTPIDPERTVAIRLTLVCVLKSIRLTICVV